MKKIIASAAAVLLSCSFLSAVSFADEGLSAEVKVNISDKDGKLALANEKITVTDIDKDGALTINDALYIAHEEFYEGGAAKGYGSSFGQYGLALDKLWGTENGGSYGYYVGSTAAMGLADTVKTGDVISAFVYTDLETWSDTFCWFDQISEEADVNDSLTLHLSGAGYDESWNPVSFDVKDAVISINGKETEYKTDENGNVTIVLQNEGRNLISASSETIILVPPAAVINVNAAAVTTSETSAATETTTSVSETTVTAETTSSSVSETTAVSTSASSSAVSTSVTAKSSPSTGDKGIGIVVALLAVSAASAVAAGRKNEK